MSEEAKLFAFKAHGAQLYGISPYSIHLHEVVNLVHVAKDPVLSLSYLEKVAWLHDVLEDTPVTFEELRDRFGYWVASPVGIVTDSADAKNRKERKRLANATFKMLDPEQITHRAALIVKAADRLANLRHSEFSKDGDKLHMYRKEHEAFEAAVRREDLVPSFWIRMKLITQPNDT